MTLNQLIYFQKTATFENYHLAAEELHISQPSLSRAISQLEEELGVTLFQKKGRGVILTKAGQIFLEYCNDILYRCDHAAVKMEELAGGGGRIDIGFVFPLAFRYIPEKVGSFLAQPENGHVSFSFIQNHTPHLVDQIRKGKLDIAFGGSYAADDLEFFPLIRQEIVIISNKPLEADAQSQVYLKVLDHAPLVGYDPHFWMGRYSKTLFAERRIEPQMRVTCPDEYSISSLVVKGLGLAIVPDMDLFDGIKGLYKYRIRDLDKVHTVYMIWSRKRPLLPASERFIEYMKNNH